MKFIKYILFFLSFACEAQTVLNTGVPVIGLANPVLPVDTGSVDINSYADLIAVSPARRMGANPVVNHANTGIFTNLAPSDWIVHPGNADRFLLYVGEHQGNTRDNSRIRAWSFDRDFPFQDAVDEGIVIQKGSGADEDNDGAGFGSVVKDGSTYYHYYVGVDGTGLGSQSVMLATSTDGLTTTKLGQVLAPDGVNEFNLTDPFVRKFGSTWYMYVTSKNSSGFPVGIVLYTSSSPTSGWTRDDIVIPLGAARDFDGLFIEGGTINLIGSDYVFMYTACSGANKWSIGIATSTNPDGPFTKEPIPWFQGGGGDELGIVDNVSVACPVLAEITTDEWWLFYQGGPHYNPGTIWDVDVAKLNYNPETFPYGYLDTYGSWDSQPWFITQSDVLPGIDSRSVQALDNSSAALGNPGFSTVIANYPIDITAAASPDASFSAIIRCSNVSAATFTGGFYVMEGATIITGIYIGGGQMKHLKTGSVWENTMAISSNTNYTVEVFLTSNSTYDVSVNGTPVATAQGETPLNNIVTKVDNLRLEKANQSSAFVYYSDMRHKTGGVTTVVNIGQ